jgi:eukaryotic-like serine/threonine-protein kinase
MDKPGRLPSDGGQAGVGAAADLDSTELFDADTDRPREMERTEPLVGNEDAAAAPAVGSKAARAKPAEATMIGEFKIIKELGQGGMGKVYKARQELLERDVALKVMAPHLAENKTLVDRFLREAKIQAKLDHPHIVKCYHIGDHHGQPFLALEFVDGGSVQLCLEKLGRFKVGDALHVILACAYALQHAHEQNLIHRDIKPDNLLINKKGVVKLADLGLAKDIAEELSLTRSGTGAGTPYYMSPEQTRNAKHCDGRTDIYAMGVMLYVMLTGQMPFEGDTTVELLQSKETGRFAPVRKTVPELPERLDLIIDKMLAKNPDHRYQTCAELVKDLESLGLANPTLSFLKTAAPAGSIKVMGAATATQTPPAKSAPTQKPKAQEEVVEGVWYVKMKTQGPKVTLRKLTTAQVSEMIKGKLLDNTFDASKSVKGTFRALATYPEFEPLLRGAVMQKRVERKAEKYQSMYEKVLQEEEQYQRRKGLRRFINNMSGWLALFAGLAVVGGGGLLVYWFWPQIAKMIGMG